MPDSCKYSSCVNLPGGGYLDFEVVLREGPFPRHYWGARVECLQRPALDFELEPVYDDWFKARQAVDARISELTK